MNVFVIDAFEFCRLKERRSGDLATLQLPRLAEEAVNKSGLIHWELEGGADNFGRPLLILSVSGVVELICQRCLAPLMTDISSIASLVVARDEVSADRIEEALGEDDAFDVIVGSRTLNVMELIEDEILLSIPFSPKHETCPDHSASGDLKSVARVSPFDVLKK